MPTYDYKCKACDHRWELVQPMSASPVKVCPHCGKRTAERLIGMGAAVLFKGSGFYQTDYRSESYKKAAEADSKSSTPAATDASASSKPTEATAAAKPAKAKPAEATKPAEASKPAAPEPKSKPGKDSRSAKSKSK